MIRFVHLLALASVVLIGGNALAAELYRSGGGGWLDANTWGGLGGPYNSATWDSGAPDSAFLEGTPGTLILSAPISIQNLNFTADSSGYVIQGGALNFAVGGIIDNQTKNVNHSIISPISGSPTVRVINNSGGSRRGFTFAPTTGAQLLGDVVLPYHDAVQAGDKGGIELGGTTTGNVVGDIGPTASNDRFAEVRKVGSSTWTTGDIRTGNLRISDGNLIISGRYDSTANGLYLTGGVLHHNSTESLGSTLHGSTSRFNGGGLDNSSGAPITSTTNPNVTITGNGFNFVGSNDLNLGTGMMTLTGSPVIDVAASNLTLGGTIADGAASYGITKTGAGTLTLAGSGAYDGVTTVSAGTLSLGNGGGAFGLPDTRVVSVAAGAALDLNFGGATDDVFFLQLGGANAAAGLWGPLGSGAPNESGLLTGNGFLNVSGGAVAPGEYYWDAVTGGNGDGASDGGSGIWNLTNDNWDNGFGAREPWPNDTATTANFAGGGTSVVTLGDNMTVSQLKVDSSNTYEFRTATGTETLTFGGAGLITVDSANAQFRNGIAGSPDIDFTSFNSTYRVLRLQPDAGVSQTIDALVVRNNTDPRIYLSGSGTGSIARLDYQRVGPAHRIFMYKEGSSTWEIGDIQSNGELIRLRVNAGTMRGTGSWTGLQDVDVRGGTLQLSGTVRMVGSNDVRLQGGQLHLNNPGALNMAGAGSALQISGGSLDNTSGAAITSSTYNPRQEWNGNFSFLGSNGSDSDLNIGSGPVAMSANRTVSVVNASSTFTVGGVIGDGGNGYSLTKAGAGTLALTGASSYSGGTTVSAGTLELGDGGSVSGAIAVDSGAVLAFNKSGNYSVTNMISGLGDVVVGGTGTIDLSGANLGGYTGTLSAEGGSFLYNGVLPGGNDVNVGLDGILGGNLTTAGTVTLAGTWSPGMSPGTATAASLALSPAGTGTYLWELVDATGTPGLFADGVAGTDWDLINITGNNVDFSSGLIIDAVGIDGSSLPALPTGLDLSHDGAQSALFEIIRTGGIADFDPSYFSFASSNLTDVGYFTVSQIGSSVYLQFTSTVPEPSTYALLGLLLATSLVFRRRQLAD